RDVSDLDGGERLDVNVGVSRLQSTKHLAVVCEPGLHVEATNDMKLFSQSVRCCFRFSKYLVQAVVICSLFLRQSRNGAEHAGFSQIANVGRIYVLVGSERDDVAVLAAIRVVGKQPEPKKIRSREEKLGVGVREAGVCYAFLGNRPGPSVREFSAR